VAKLLDKLLIEQTKSRAHHSGDNGLVESKNGAIIRKHMGFGHIDAQHAEAMDQFHREHLNPYINFHRPCAVPKILTQANGKRRRVYLRWATPFELFRELPRCRAICGQTSLWRNWITSPKPNPIPKRLWICNAPSAGSSKASSRAYTA
jgi:hypothetical protein